MAMAPLSARTAFPLTALRCPSPLWALPLRLRRTLDAELEPVLLSKAAQFNLPADWITRLDQQDPERRQVGLRMSIP